MYKIKNRFIVLIGILLFSVLFSNGYLVNAQQDVKPISEWFENESLAKHVAWLLNENDINNKVSQSQLNTILIIDSRGEDGWGTVKAPIIDLASFEELTPLTNLKEIYFRDSQPQNFKDFHGIEKFSDLTILQLANAQLESMAGIESAKKLKSITLYENSVNKEI